MRRIPFPRPGTLPACVSVDSHDSDGGARAGDVVREIANGAGGER